MYRSGKISRRGFIKIIGYGVGMLFAGIWLVMTKRAALLAEPEMVTLDPHELAEGLTFSEKIICYKEKEGLRFYKASCTHLGCRLNQAENGAIVCPCHGSRFDIKSGLPLKGPATKPLQQLDYSFGDNGNTVKIFVR